MSSHVRFHAYLAITFIAAITVFLLSQDINNGLAQLVSSSEESGSTQQLAQLAPPQNPVPVQYQVQAVPQAFKPTAIPPGNNVAAPLNTGPDAQSKSGSLSAGSLNAGSLSAGSVSTGDVSAGTITTSGDINVNGSVKLKNFTLGVTFDNAGEDVYTGFSNFEIFAPTSIPYSQRWQYFLTRVVIDWSALKATFYSDPIIVDGQSFREDSCNSDHQNPYVCPV